MKKVTVVGGGTAGWFTALLTRAYYPHVDITLIESEEIGILGAGEGTTPHFVELLGEIGVSLQELIIEADATLKNGIRFINWNGDGRDYFHSFTVNKDLDQITNFTVLSAQMSKKYHLDEINFVRKLSNDYRTGFYYVNNTGFNSNPLNFVNTYSQYGVHFNARKFAAFLAKKANERNITHVEGRVKRIVNTEHGFVKELELENGTIISSDFVFDCTGFARLFIGKHYNTEWQSYADHLPMNTGLPFFIEHDNANEDLFPETKSIAMSSGWIWQIPVHDRYGCGYVFDNNYITEDQALAEAENYFGRKLTVPKVFNFKAGSYKKTLVKNALAIGLSQSFVEPLEATSIFIAYLNLRDFLKCNGLYVNSTTFETTYNNRCLNRNNNVRDFLYFHYLTKRDDSPFWREFRQRNSTIESMEHDWELITQSPTMQLCNETFGNYSWLQVGVGLELINPHNYFTTFKSVDNEYAYNLLEWCKRKQDNLLKSCINHKEFIEFILQ
jgi:tryptophan halogenase